MSTISAHIDNEIANAKKIHKQSILTTRNILIEVAKGKRTDISELHEMISQIIDSLQNNPHALTCLIKYKSPDDFLVMHSLSSCILNAAFCLALDKDARTTKAIALGGLLADVGKFRIPQDILYKQKALTPEEQELIQKHVKLSHALAARIPRLEEETLQAILHHHENYDGTGYPDAIKGDDISLAGQMTRIVDIFDTQISERTNCPSKEPTDVLKKMMSRSGTYYDKSLLNKFIHSIGIYPVGTMVVLSNGQLSVVIDQNPDTLLAPKVRTLFDMKKKQLLHTREDISIDEAGLKILTHTSRNQFRINPISALGQ